MHEDNVTEESVGAVSHPFNEEPAQASEAMDLTDAEMQAKQQVAMAAAAVAAPVSNCTIKKPSFFSFLTMF